MLGEEFTGKSYYTIFFKLKNKTTLGEFHVSQIHVRRGLPVKFQKMCYIARFILKFRFERTIFYTEFLMRRVLEMMQNELFK